VEPLQALESAGATAHIVSPKAGAIRGWKHRDWGDSFAVDATLDQADPRHYDALILPGGVMNPDTLRRDPSVQLRDHPDRPRERGRKLGGRGGRGGKAMAGASTSTK